MNKINVKSNISLDPFKKEIAEKLGLNCSDNDVLRLYRYIDECERCRVCKCLDDCKQDSKGYYPVLNKETLKIVYDSCKYMKEMMLKNKQANCIDAQYMPKKILEASLTDYYIDSPSRQKAFAKATSFCLDFNKSVSKKGMYIHGEYGVGKTFLLAAIANELSKKGIKSLLIYFPDLARAMKSSIEDGSLEKKIDLLKTADVLMLDDLGSEMMTSWIRDEILGPVLQYRVLEELPVFISSNFNRSELIKHLSSTKEGLDVTKGTRIVKRIIDLADEFKIINNKGGE